MADRVDCIQNHPTGHRHTKIHVYALHKGNLEVKLPTTRRDGKAEVGRVKEERRRRREDQRRERVRRKKMQVVKKLDKKRFTVFVPLAFGSGGSKSWLAKTAGAETSGQMRDEKLHAVKARSTFRSQNVQNTLAPEHF